MEGVGGHSLKTASCASENVVGYDCAVGIFQVDRATRHVVDRVRAAERNDISEPQAREGKKMKKQGEQTGEHYEEYEQRYSMLRCIP